MSDNGFNCNALNHAAEDSQLNAFDPASESSEKSSAFSDDRSMSRGRPRKRRITEISTSSHSRLKRLKYLYKDDYRKLLNGTVAEIASFKSLETDTQLQKSQIGVTLWSSEEKGAFFRALARRGRHDIRGIAADVGTKSESEVYVYSDVLFKAAADQQIHRIRKSPLDDTSNQEAAFEVQEDCCAALNLAGEALSALQQNEEERAEKQKHKEFALLTPRIARWVERCVEVPPGGKEDVIQQIPAAGILNLMNFLALSKRFFMNSVIAEDNWRSYIGKKIKSPSIMYAAFSDFHTLLVSITQRLVQTSLFFAMSRLRAMSASGHYIPESHVRLQDVLAAINVLGMKTNAKLYWARLARKCKLRVYDNVRHRKVFGKKYSYAELERILSPSMTSDPDSPKTTTKDASTSKSQEASKSRECRTLKYLPGNALDISISSDSMSDSDGGLTALSKDEEPLASTSHSTNDQDHKQEGYDALQDAYLEALDLQTSRDEERRLWEILGENAAEKMEPIDVKLAKSPLPKRKDEYELLDWTGFIDYAGEWERHKTQVFGSIFAISQGFKEDIDLVTGLTSSRSNSGSLVNDVTTDAEPVQDSDEDTDSDRAMDDGEVRRLSADDIEH